jgi:hypothetical protein
VKSPLLKRKHPSNLYRAVLECWIARDVIQGKTRPPSGVTDAEYSHYLLVSVLEEIVVALQEIKEGGKLTPTEKTKYESIRKERDMLRAEIDRTYKSWVGRNWMHLPLCEAVGKAMLADKEGCK